MLRSCRKRGLAMPTQENQQQQTKEDDALLIAEEFGDAVTLFRRCPRDEYLQDGQYPGGQHDPEGNVEAVDEGGFVGGVIAEEVDVKDDDKQAGDAHQQRNGALRGRRDHIPDAQQEYAQSRQRDDFQARFEQAQLVGFLALGQDGHGRRTALRLNHKGQQEVGADDDQRQYDADEMQGTARDGRALGLAHRPAPAVWTFGGRPTPSPGPLPQRAREGELKPANT